MGRIPRREGQEEAWKGFADRVGGRFVPRGGSTHRVELCVGAWAVALDTAYTYPGFNHTRLVTEYSGSDGFEIQIFPANLLTRIGTLLGGPNLEMRDEELARHYIARASDEGKARELLADPAVRSALLRLRYVYGYNNDGVRLGEPPRAGCRAKLYTHYQGVVTDPDLLDALLELHSGLLAGLERVGSAASPEEMG